MKGTKSTSKGTRAGAKKYVYKRFTAEEVSKVGLYEIVKEELKEHTYEAVMNNFKFTSPEQLRDEVFFQMLRNISFKLATDLEDEAIIYQQEHFYHLAKKNSL